jgi:hypothetical protein
MHDAHAKRKETPMNTPSLEELHRDPELLAALHREARRARAEAIRSLLGALAASVRGWLAPRRVPGRLTARMG